MKTTLSIDDTLLRDLKQIAVDTKTPLKEVIDRTLRAGMASERRGPRRREFPRFALGSPGGGGGFDRALMLAAGFGNDSPRRLGTRK